MKKRLLIVMALAVFCAGSALIAMNNACKVGQHAWCTPTSDVTHHS
jgi:hypothetical protein